MSANIEVRTMRTSDGIKEIASFFSTQPEWHKLGEVFDAPLTSVDAIKACHADYEVSKQPIVALSPELLTMVENGDYINAKMLKDLIVEGTVATMRTDRHETLGIVGDTYGVVQNTDAFKFIDELCSGGSNAPCIESAGVLGYGERVFITAKFPEPIRLAHKDNDLVNMYIVFTTSHDGKGAVTAMVTPIRVVCNNTLNMAFAHNSGRWNCRHSSKVHDRLFNIAEATRSLKLYDVYKAEFEERMTQLAKIHLTDKDMEKFAVRSLVADDVWKTYVNSEYNLNSEDISAKARNQVTLALESIYGGIGQKELETNTALHAYNGLTFYLDHVARNKENERQFNSIMIGTAYTKQQRGFEHLMSLAV